MFIETQQRVVSQGCCATNEIFINYVMGPGSETCNSSEDIEHRLFSQRESQVVVGYEQVYKMRIRMRALLYKEWNGFEKQQLESRVWTLVTPNAQSAVTDTYVYLCIRKQIKTKIIKKIIYLCIYIYICIHLVSLPYNPGYGWDH